MVTQPKLPDPGDTIVALSSATGPAARAIVRLSGRRAGEIVRAVCPDFDAANIERGRFFSGRLRLSSFRVPIPADIYFFKAPRTYTGQDLAEIHLISSPPIVEALIADCLTAGARAALAGEFTMRAFLAGKLDLTRAEAVLGVIDAADRHELKRAMTQLAGGIAQPLQDLRDNLLDLLADVEAGLDFTEEAIHFVSAEELLKRLAYGLAHLITLRRQLEQRASGQRRFRVALAGRANAGKSSLFNALLGKDAALVSATPGTTRDYLEATLDLAGVTIELVDTAGLDDPVGAIEHAAQSLGREQSRQADLILWCVPCDESGGDISETAAVCIATKCDRAPVSSQKLATSAVTGAGLDGLRAFLAQRVQSAGHAPLAPSLSRCKHHVEAGIAHLRNAHATVIHEEMPELLAVHLRLALDDLGAMTGAIYTEDLLDRIFSRFCIGK